MEDCAYFVVNKFRGKMVFINVTKNISIGRDRDGNSKPPCTKDIGISFKTDPISIGKARSDLIYNSEELGKNR